MTNVEIEDVLSSIRRLVSEDTRLARGRPAGAAEGSLPGKGQAGDAGADQVADLGTGPLWAGRPEGAAKLVLTPALRVPSAPAAKRSDADDGAADDAGADDPRSDDSGADDRGAWDAAAEWHVDAAADRAARDDHRGGPDEGDAAQDSGDGNAPATGDESARIVDPWGEDAAADMGAGQSVDPFVEPMPGWIAGSGALPQDEGLPGGVTDDTTLLDDWSAGFDAGGRTHADSGRLCDPVDLDLMDDGNGPSADAAPRPDDADRGAAPGASPATSGAADGGADDAVEGAADLPAEDAEAAPADAAAAGRVWPGSRRSGAAVGRGAQASLATGDDPAEDAEDPAPWQRPGARLMDSAQGRGTLRTGRAGGEPRVSVEGDGDPHGQTPTSLERTIAELEAAVAEISGEFEPDGGSATTDPTAGRADWRIAGRAQPVAPVIAGVGPAYGVDRPSARGDGGGEGHLPSAAIAGDPDDGPLDEPVAGGLSVSDWTLPWPTIVTPLHGAAPPYGDDARARVHGFAGDGGGSGTASSPGDDIGPGDPDIDMASPGMAGTAAAGSSPHEAGQDEIGHGGNLPGEPVSAVSVADGTRVPPVDRGGDEAGGVGRAVAADQGGGVSPRHRSERDQSAEDAESEAGPDQGRRSEGRDHDGHQAPVAESGSRLDVGDTGVREADEPGSAGPVEAGPVEGPVDFGAIDMAIAEGLAARRLHFASGVARPAVQAALPTDALSGGDGIGDIGDAEPGIGVPGGSDRDDAKARSPVSGGVAVPEVAATDLSGGDVTGAAEGTGDEPAETARDEGHAGTAGAALSVSAGEDKGDGGPTRRTARRIIRSGGAADAGEPVAFGQDWPLSGDAGAAGHWVGRRGIVATPDRAAVRDGDEAQDVGEIHGSDDADGPGASGTAQANHGAGDGSAAAGVSDDRGDIGRLDEADRNLFGDSEPGAIDPEALRDLVEEIIRQELQGSLGERITRSVRRLVRREVHRILEARDLE